MLFRSELRQVGEIMQSMAKEAGIDISLRATEFATSLNAAEKGDFDAYILAWSGRVDPDGNSFIFYKTKAPQNNGMYSDADVDQWLDDQRKVGTVAERKAIYEKIAGKVLTEGSIIYLYHQLSIIAHTTKLQGYTQLADGLVRVTGLKLAP